MIWSSRGSCPSDVWSFVAGLEPEALIAGFRIWQWWVSRPKSKPPSDWIVIGGSSKAPTRLGARKSDNILR